MHLSVSNSRVICVTLLLMLMVISGCGMLSIGKDVRQEKGMRFSPDILNRLGLTEKWVIKSLVGDTGTIVNAEKFGDSLFIFSSNCALYCIDITTGDVVWENRLPRRYGSLAYMSNYKDRVLVVVSNNVYEFAVSNGMETNHWELPISPTTPVTRDEDKLFVGATDNRIYCLNISNLTEIWKSLQDGHLKGKIWLETGMDREVPFGKVYFACDDGVVYAARYDQRKLLWPLKTAGDVSGVVFDKGQCFMSSTDTALYCVDSSDGCIFWKYLSGGKMYEMPSVTQELVYQSVYNKSLVCLNRFPDGKKPGTGVNRLTPAVVWELTGGTEFLCEAGDKAYVVNDAGQIVVMNNRTGGKEFSAYLSDVDIYIPNTEDDKLILANKAGDIMVLEPLK